MSSENFSVKIVNIGGSVLDFKLDESTGWSSRQEFNLAPGGEQLVEYGPNPGYDYVLFEVISSDFPPGRKYVFTPIEPAPGEAFAIDLKQGIANEFDIKIYAPQDSRPTNVEVGVRE